VLSDELASLDATTADAIAREGRLVLIYRRQPVGGLISSLVCPAQLTLRRDLQIQQICATLRITAIYRRPSRDLIKIPQDPPT
jgi:hypothetical protein